MNLRPIRTLRQELSWLMPTLELYFGWGNNQWRRFPRGELRRGNVYLVPGFGEGTVISERAAQILRAQGYRVYMPETYKYGLMNIGSMKRYDRLVLRSLGKLIENNGQFILVGYSKGGLSCLQALRKYNEYISKVIIIACPVRGCDLAGFIWPIAPFWSLVRQLRPGSKYLKNLVSGLIKEMLDKVISISCQNDGIVWPSRTFLPGAKNIISSATHLQAYIEEGMLTQVGILADAP